MTPVLLCLGALVPLLWAEWHDSAWLRALSKLTASSAFVWAAIAAGALETSFGTSVLVGLVLCWAGDALLLVPGQGWGFRLGLGAFLLGHLAYAAACLQLSLSGTALALGIALLCGFAWRVLGWLRPKVPQELQLPVVAYVTAISAMVALAVAASAAGAPLALGIGAVGFAASDLSVARERFVTPGFVNAAWGLPAYFAAQLAIASSV